MYAVIAGGESSLRATAHKTHSHVQWKDITQKSYKSEQSAVYIDEGKVLEKQIPVKLLAVKIILLCKRQVILCTFSVNHVSIIHNETRRQYWVSAIHKESYWMDWTEAWWSLVNWSFGHELQLVTEKCQSHSPSFSCKDTKYSSGSQLTILLFRDTGQWP